MNRRTAFKNIALATGSLITLPFWMVSCGISDKDTHVTGFSVPEQEIIAKIADTIIPGGTSIGALAVGVDKYLVKLIDDCYDESFKENVKKQLDIIHRSTMSEYDEEFFEATEVAREHALITYSQSTDPIEQEFFKFMKSETIRGYNTSKEVLEGHLGYKIAPGHYYGSVNINA
jgi:hypothetical protein